MSVMKTGKQVIATLEKQGWTVMESTQAGHIKMTHPAARGIMVIGKRFKCNRGAENTLALARRMVRQATESAHAEASTRLAGSARKPER